MNHAPTIHRGRMGGIARALGAGIAETCGVLITLAAVRRPHR